MAIDDAYSTPQAYRDALTKRDAGKNEDIEADLLATSRYLERCLHTFFTKDDEPVARYYTPKHTTMKDGWAEAENPWMYLKGEQYLHTDPIASLVDLEVVVDTDRDFDYNDETPLASNSYILLPRNALTGPEPAPYTDIMKTDLSVWTPGAEVKVTAVFGWPQVPKVIERLTIQLCGILRFESPRARAITEIDSTMEASRDAQAIIHEFKRAYRKQLGFGIS